METGPKWLFTGALLTGAASLMHVAIIVGGSEWYRFFGAGERMARLATRGSAYPAIVTAAIAATLAVWAAYGLSGARIIRRLPLQRLALLLIAGAFLTRGILGVPVVILVDHPYTNELRVRMTFMVVTSLICIGIGVCYLRGAMFGQDPADSR